MAPPDVISGQRVGRSDWRKIRYPARNEIGFRGFVVAAWILYCSRRTFNQTFVRKEEDGMKSR